MKMETQEKQLWGYISHTLCYHKYITKGKLI
jgi:hypothetical protein